MPAHRRTTEHVPAAGGRPPLELVRSTRRRRTATARARGEVVEVLLPAGLSRAEEQRLIDGLVQQVQRRASRRATDQLLVERAAHLADRYLGGVRPTSITWSERMAHRWGSCTTVDGTIRISSRLRDAPRYVLDYVVVHELAHLLEPGHGPAFKALEARYPHVARASAFLDGYAMGLRADEPADAPAPPPRPRRPRRAPPPHHLAPTLFEDLTAS